MEQQSINYPTDENEIDQDQARFLYEQHCAILVIEHLPVRSEFGIDLSSFIIGDKFKGVKLIPPGVHFVFASSIDKTGRQHGPRCGFFHEFQKNELLIKRWLQQDEDFDDAYEASNEERERYANNLRDLDRYLGAYRFGTYATYLKLISHLTPKLMLEMIPDCQRIRAMPYLTREDQSKSSNSATPELTKRQLRRSLIVCDKSKPSENNLLPDLKPAKETQIKFTTIPTDHTYSNLSSHSDITHYNLDTTMKLDQTFAGEAGLSRLLGEFQFAFIALLLGHVYDCFEQWQKLLKLVCSADAALSKYDRFFIDFTRVLSTQLDQVPQDLFEDITDRDNLIRYHLDNFFQNVDQSRTSLNQELVSQVLQLRQLLERKFKWQFDVEPDEEQPVVVEL